MIKTQPKLSFTLVSKSLYDPYGENKGKASKALFKTIKNDYGLEFDEKKVKDLGGSYNLNLLLKTTKGKRVARLFQPYLTVKRLLEVQKVRAHLSRNGVPTGKIISTVQGETFALADGRLLEMEGYVSAEEKMDNWEKLQEGIKTLAKIHNLLDDFEVEKSGENPLVANQVEPELALPWAQRGIKFVLANKPTAKERLFCHKAADLAKKIAVTQTEIYQKLPRQLTHGDFWGNNVFFKNGLVCHVGDFDFTGKRARIDDLALPIWAMIARTGQTYSKDFLQEVKKVVKSYDENLKKPLSVWEKKALPLAIARISLVFVGILASFDSRKMVSQEIQRRAAAVDWSLGFWSDLVFWQKELK